MTTPPERIEEIVKEFMSKVDICTHKGLHIETTCTGLIHLASGDVPKLEEVIRTTLHQELQKAREELVYEIRADLLNYRDERLDDNASITNIAIRIGLNYTRKDHSKLDQPLPDKQ